MESTPLNLSAVEIDSILAVLLLTALAGLIAFEAMVILKRF
jgi:hypothetical protein